MSTTATINIIDLQDNGTIQHCGCTLLGHIGMSNWRPVMGSARATNWQTGHRYAPAQRIQYTCTATPNLTDGIPVLTEYFSRNAPSMSSGRTLKLHQAPMVRQSIALNCLGKKDNSEVFGEGAASLSSAHFISKTLWGSVQGLGVRSSHSSDCITCIDPEMTIRTNHRTRAAGDGRLFEMRRKASAEFRATRERATLVVGTSKGGRGSCALC